MSILSISGPLKNDKTTQIASQVLGDPYFSSCPQVVLKDMYGRDVNSIHEIGHNPKYFTNCQDPSDVIDTEGTLTRSAWITSINAPVNFGAGNCGVNRGNMGYDTMALNRDQQDHPMYQLFSDLQQGAQDFPTDQEVLQRYSQIRNRPYSFINV
jgi:hypothetical protein